jgi:hypothetical protein
MTLEELFMATFLRVLPDGYREHFVQCSLHTAEELAPVADILWEIRSGNAATVVVDHQAAAVGQQLRGQQVWPWRLVAAAATMVAMAARTGTPCLGELV